MKADCNPIVTPLHCKIIWNLVGALLVTLVYLALSLTITRYLGANALEAAIAAVCKYGGASAGYRTLLDALIPASSVLKEV